MFYILLNPDNIKDRCFVSDDDCLTLSFDTELEAIEAAKEYSGTMEILKPVTRITEKTTRKYKKIK